MMEIIFNNNDFLFSSEKDCYNYGGFTQTYYYSYLFLDI